MCLGENWARIIRRKGVTEKFSKRSSTRDTWRDKTFTKPHLALYPYVKWLLRTPHVKCGLLREKERKFLCDLLEQRLVCFELAKNKTKEVKMEYVTISKSEYDYLVTQAKRIKFINHYRPTIVRDVDTGEYSISVDTMGIIDTLRYSEDLECIDRAIEDMRGMQKVFWVLEETEIYAGRTIEEILHKFYPKEEKEILSDNLYGTVDLNQKYAIKADIGSIAIEKRIKELLDEMVVFPDLVLSSYS